MPNAEPVTTGSTTSRSRRPSGSRSRGGSAAAPAPPAASGTGPLPAGDASPDQPRPAGSSESTGAQASGQPPAAGSGAAEESGRPRERWLAAARARHTPGTGKEPMTPEQLTYLLDLLHKDGQDQRLVSETYGYLDRGMSKAHASIQIKKLRGEFVDMRAAA